jgi:hypothetical protein
MNESEMNRKARNDDDDVDGDNNKMRSLKS